MRPTIKIIAAALLFTLVACATPTVVPITHVEKKLEIAATVPAPLELSDVKFKVVQIDGKLYVSLDLDNFKKLARNMEQVQGQLGQYNLIIQQYQQYYETHGK